MTAIMSSSSLFSHNLKLKFRVMFLVPSSTTLTIYPPSNPYPLRHCSSWNHLLTPPHPSALNHRHQSTPAAPSPHCANLWQLITTFIRATTLYPNLSHHHLASPIAVRTTHHRAGLLPCETQSSRPAIAAHWKFVTVRRYISPRHRHSVRYVVDAADQESINITRRELHDLLDKPSLTGIPLLVLGNKINKPEALCKEALTDQMDLKSITGREVCCYMVSCKNSSNIDEVTNWLVKHSKLKSKA